MTVKWNRFLCLLFGVLLLAIGAYFSWRVATGWKPIWRQQEARQPHSTFSTADQVSDPATEAARLHVYGALASSANTSPEQQDEDPNSPPRPAPRVHAAVDHVTAAPDDAPKHFLHKRFSLRSYEGFEFVVPPHAIQPRLQGTFKCFAKGNGTTQPADADLLLLNDQEFADFLNGQVGTATFTNDPSDSGEIDWILNSPRSQPQKYYLIFRNSPGGTHIKLVDADFTVSFD